MVYYLMINNSDVGFKHTLDGFQAAWDQAKAYAAKYRSSVDIYQEDTEPKDKVGQVTW